MFNEVYKPTFERRIPKEDTFFLGEHNVEVKFQNRKISTIIQFKNTLNSAQNLEIDFSASKNFKILGNCEVQKNKCNIEIQGIDSVIIELVPKDIKQPMDLKDFNVSRINK